MGRRLGHLFAFPISGLNLTISANVWAPWRTKRSLAGEALRALPFKQSFRNVVSDFAGFDACTQSANLPQFTCQLRTPALACVKTGSVSRRARLNLGP
jgi:hypothetical protein